MKGSKKMVKTKFGKFGRFFFFSDAECFRWEALLSIRQSLVAHETMDKSQSQPTGQSWQVPRVRNSLAIPWHLKRWLSISY